MKTINRSVITILPKQPYIDWANSFEDGGPSIGLQSIHATSLLIPEEFDEFSYEQFLKKNCKTIFEEELSAWMTDPKLWPPNINYDLFTQWFQVIVSDTVLDLGNAPLVVEEY